MTNEPRRRLDEARARMMVRVVNRTFKQRPTRLDRIAIRIVEKATGP